MRRLGISPGVVGWVLGLLVVFGFAIYSYEKRIPSIDTRRTHDSDSYNRWGTRALYELLEQQGFDGRVWRARLDRLNKSQSLLFVLSPTRHFVRAEVDRLLEWVEGGGTVVLAPSRHTKVASMYIDPDTIPPIQQLLGPMGLFIDRGPVMAGSAHVETDHRLLDGVKSLYVPSHLRIVQADAERLREEYADVVGDTRLAEYFLPRIAPEQFTSLVELDGRTVVGHMAHGKGSIIVLAEADMLGNYWISRGDNVLLAANIAYQSSAQRVHFDEFHHGSSLFSIEAEETRASAAWQVIRLALLAIAIFLVLQAVRFGAAVPRHRKARRSAREFVDALAELYRQAGASRAAARILGTNLKYQVARAGRLGGGHGGGALPNDRLARECAARNPNIDEQALLDLLNRLDAAAASWDRPAESDVLRIAQDASRIEKELLKRAGGSAVDTRHRPTDL